MAIRIPWSDEEAALLLHTLIDVLNNKTSRREAVSNVSKELCALAIRNGIEIDEKYRNENGIALQMSKLEYVFTDGKSGLAVQTGWYFRIVEIYNTDSIRFEQLWKEAAGMSGEVNTLRDQFFDWLSKRVSLAQLSELYFVFDEVEKYCISHHVLNKSLFMTTEPAALKEVYNTITKNRLFRLTHKGNLSKMSSAVSQYITYAKEYFPNGFSTAELNKTDTVAVTPAEKSERLVLHNSDATADMKRSAPDMSPVTEIETVDLETERQYVFTKPVSYTYFGDKTEVNSWRSLYISCLQTLFEDYPTVLQDMRGTALCGKGKPDIGSKAESASMISPKQIADDVYVEANYSASDLMKRLRQILIACNVDFEHLQISFRGEDAPAQKVSKNVLPAREISKMPDLEGAITISLKENRTFAFTTPVMFSYYDRVSAVKNWTELYTKCCGMFYQERPDVFDALEEHAITGTGRMDVAKGNRQKLMTAPRQIAVGVYMETNYSATDLMRRLRELAVRCGVNPGAVQIAYKERKSSAEDGKNTPILLDHAVSTMTAASEPDAQMKFSAWMVSKGMANATINSYLSALRQCGEFAKRKGFLTGSILLIPQINDVIGLQNRLNNDPDFVSWNIQQHHRFGAALKKYIEYRTAGNAPVSVPIDTPVHKTVCFTESQAKPSITADVAKKYTVVLREEFPDGLRQNIIHVKKFMQRYEARYGTIDATKENLLDQLRTVGVIRDDRIYPRQDSDQRSLMDDIYDTITGVFDNGGTCVYMSMLLERYSSELSDQLGVYNEETLQALLLERNPEYYLIRHGYVCQSVDRADAAYDVLQFMQKNHKPLNYDQIQQALWYIPMEKIKHALVVTDSLVNVDLETYYYAPNLPISAEELQSLVRAMSSEIEMRGFLVSQHLHMLIDQNCPSAAIDTAFLKDWGIRNCLSYILRGEFEFAGALVSRKGHEITMADAYREFSQEHEVLTLTQLKEFSSEVNVPIYWDTVLSVMVRTSPNEMLRADKVRFDVEATDRVLDRLCDDDYVPIQEIRLFLQLPPISVPWNGFVLECYLKNHSKQFRLEQVSVTENGFYGAMVRNSSPYQDYEQVVVDMLAHSHAWTDQKSALELIVTRGYQARRRWTNFAPVMKKAMLLREKLETMQE